MSTPKRRFNLLSLTFIVLCFKSFERFFTVVKRRLLEVLEILDSERKPTVLKTGKRTPSYAFFENNGSNMR